MKQTARTAVVRMNELQKQIDFLAGMRPSPHPVISAYLDLRQETARLKRFVHRRIAACANVLPAHQRVRLRACAESIIEQLADQPPPHAHGLAIFATADGAAPVLSAMPFAAPFRNSLTVSPSPDLFPLLRLREMYGRFTIITAQPEGLRVVEVNLGEVAIRAWAATPNPPSPMTGHNGNATAADLVDIQPQVRLIERVLTKIRSGPLFLVGEVETMQRIRGMMTSISTDRLAGAMRAPADEALKRTAARCLRSLIELEVHQASALSARVVQEVRHRGPAVTGSVASLRALRSGTVKRLVLSNSYRPEPGWTCELGAGKSRYRSRLQYALGGDAGIPDESNLRVELIRLAGRRRIPVEFAIDDTLNEFGGVACLLRDHPEQVVQQILPRYGRLDLVA